MNNFRIKIKGCLVFITVALIGIITMLIGYTSVVGALYLLNKLPDRNASKQTVEYKPAIDTTACNAAYIDNWGTIEDPE